MLLAQACVRYWANTGGTTEAGRTWTTGPSTYIKERLLYCQQTWHTHAWTDHHRHVYTTYTDIKTRMTWKLNFINLPCAGQTVRGFIINLDVYTFLKIMCRSALMDECQHVPSYCNIVNRWLQCPGLHWRASSPVYSECMRGFYQWLTWLITPASNRRRMTHRFRLRESMWEIVSNPVICYQGNGWKNIYCSVAVQAKNNGWSKTVYDKESRNTVFITRQSHWKLPLFENNTKETTNKCGIYF